MSPTPAPSEVSCVPPEPLVEAASRNTAAEPLCAVGGPGRAAVSWAAWRTRWWRAQTGHCPGALGRRAGRRGDPRGCPGRCQGRGAGPRAHREGRAGGAGRRPDRWPAVPPAGEAGVRLPHRLLPGGGREDHRLRLPLPPGRLPAQRLECHGLHHRLPGVRPPGRPRGSLPPRALLRHVTPRCSGGRSSLRP